MQNQVKLKSRSLIKSFNYAFEGIIYVVRTQRNMKIHIGAALIVLILGLLVGLNKLELAILLVLIFLVIITELLNTAVEATIDGFSTEFDPIAKIAKDVAAAAVLMAAGAAMIIGYLLFFERLNKISLNTLLAIKRSSIHITYISLIIIFLVAIIIKAIEGNEDSVFRGGMPSVHSAIAFGSATSIAFITDNAIASTLAIIMALLVSQSRIEAEIHNVVEVIVGALIGIVITVLIFQLAG